LAELLKGEIVAAPSKPLTLGGLWRRYSTECEEYRDNKPETQKDAEAQARVLRAYFGEHFRVEDFSRNHQRAYEVARRAGGILIVKGDETYETPKTRARSAEADIGLLHTMLRWAATVRLPSGKFL